MDNDQPELIPPQPEVGTSLTPRELERNMLYREVYENMKDGDPALQTCPVCGESGSKNSMDRHHPAGRFGKNICFYIYVCRPCHRWIHHDVATATENGFLIPGRTRTQLTAREQATAHNLILDYYP